MSGPSLHPSFEYIGWLLHRVLDQPCFLGCPCGADGSIITRRLAL